MRKAWGGAGAFFVMLACAGMVWAEAGPGDFPPMTAEGIGMEGFAGLMADGGRGTEEAPLLIAKKRKKKKKKGSDEDYSSGSGTGIHLDPNTANVKELMVLPLVDEKTAQAIIAHRPYKTAEDLIKVPEVGPTKYRIFKHLIEIKAAEETAPGMEAAPAAEGGEQAGEAVEEAPK